MLIRYGYEIAIACPRPTPVLTMMGLHDEHRADLVVPEDTVTTPDVPYAVFRDAFGNTVRRLVAPAGSLAIRGDGIVDDDGLPDPADRDAPEIPVAELPEDCLAYLLPSRYCESDLLGDTAWSLFGDVAPGWGRVQAICDHVHGHIAFAYDRASATRTALGAHREGVGVCRDFAHLAIAFCRCLNIPARYVNGYMGDIGVPESGPGDFNAWIEVWLGDRWWTFDPRNNARRLGRLVIARGRDATDIPMLNSFGRHELTAFQVWTHEVRALPVSVAA